MDEDSVDIIGQPYYYVFKDIVIDPIKPYVYAFITKTNYYGDDDLDITCLKVYNYETMQEVKDLTPIGFEKELMTSMDISDDGRYLAVLNEGKSYLKIWNTETFELITDRPLYDDSYSDIKDYWCKAGDIEFSHINNDLIYLSGVFPNRENSENPNFSSSGFYKYEKSKDSFHKEYLGPNQNGKFVLFDNEERVLLGPTAFVILNQKTKVQEIYINSDIKYPTGFGNLYSEKFNLFIGKGSRTFSGFRYDSQTRIEKKYDDEIIISPNPTNSFVNLNLKCLEPKASYQINDMNGLMVFQSSMENQVSSIQIDFSPYPAGVYFITVTCGNELKSYKVVRE